MTHGNTRTFQYPLLSPEQEQKVLQKLTDFLKYCLQTKSFKFTALTQPHLNTMSICKVLVCVLLSLTFRAYAERLSVFWSEGKKPDQTTLWGFWGTELRLPNLWHASTIFPFLLQNYQLFPTKNKSYFYLSSEISLQCFSEEKSQPAEFLQHSSLHNYTPHFPLH